MDVKQIRKQNAKRLAQEVGSWAELARRSETDPKYLSQIVSEKGTRQIGDNLARRMEAGCNKPHGWLDHPHAILDEAHSSSGESIGPATPSSLHANVVAGPRIRGRVPLISWVQAGDWTEAVDVFHPEDAEEWVVSAFNHSDSAFALRVKGISMEPEFREGEIIIVDPACCADPGRFVVAKKANSSETTFKQLIQDGTEFYLKALNPSWPEPIIRMNEEWVVIGVVIGKTKSY